MSTSTLGLFLRHLALSEEVSRLGNTSDHNLLATYEAEQGQAAFAELMRRHGPMVLRTCRRVLGHGPDAEDAFQATFVLLARNASQLRHEVTGPLSLGGWLHRVAYRTALKVLSGEVRRRVHEQQASVMTHPAPDPSAEATWNEIQPILDAELDALPEQARKLLIACYLQGKTHAEAAAESRLPLGSLARHLERARGLLARRLARRGITVSAAMLAILLDDLASGAGVPAVLLVHTLEAARTFTEHATGLVSDNVARLVKGGLAQMTKSSTHFGIWLAGWVGLLGIGLIACQTLKAWPDRPPVSEPPETLAERPAQEGDKQVRTDLYGDPLPKGALARLGTTRLRHLSYEARPLAFSRDGKTLASVGLDETVRWWEVATGKEIRTLPPVWVEHQGHKYRARLFSAAITLDGKTVATGCDGVVRLWDTVSGKEIRTLKGPTRKAENGENLTVGVQAVAFAPDGKTVASVWHLGSPGDVRLWEVATGEEIHSLKHNERAVRSVAFTPDGKTVAVGEAKGTVYLWEAATGKEISTLQGSKGRVASVTFAPDGKTVAVMEEDGMGWMVCLREVASGKEICTLQGPAGFSVTFAPDGKTLASLYGDGTVRLWETATGKEIRTLRGHKEREDQGRDVRSVAFSPDGKVLATGAKDGVVRLWEVATGKPILMPRGHEGLCLRVAFAPDGKTVVTGGADGTVRLWEAVSGKEIHTLRGDKGQALKWQVTSVAFSPDGKTLTSGARDGTVRLWEAATGKEIGVLQTPKKPKGEVDSVNAVAFAPDGKTLASGESGGTVCLWEVATGKEVRTLRANTGQVRQGKVWSVAFSPDGKTVASGEDDGTMRLWEAATAKETRTLTFGDKGGSAERPRVTSVVFSPDGRTVASGQDNGMVRLWGVSSGKEIRTLQGVKETKDWWSCNVEVGVAFSRDGRILAASSGDRVLLWDLLSGTALPPLAGHQAPVHGVAFSPNGKALASVSADSTGLVWDLTYGADRPAMKRDANALETLWTDLASKDGARAKRAVWNLVATPAQSVPLLRDRLRPVPADLGKRLAQLVADLDADNFQVRQKAYRALEKMGPDAEPALRKGLEGRPSVEIRKRLEQLLEAVGEQNRRGFSGEVLRGLRAVEVLEQIGTPQARQVLQTLADGAPGFLTQEAQAALRRLEETRRDNNG